MTYFAQKTDGEMVAARAEYKHNRRLSLLVDMQVVAFIGSR
jgi:hypothetical protein